MRARAFVCVYICACTFTRNNQYASVIINSGLYAMTFQSDCIASVSLCSAARYIYILQTLRVYRYTLSNFRDFDYIFQFAREPADLEIRASRARINLDATGITYIRVFIFFFLLLLRYLNAAHAAVSARSRESY